MNLTNAIRLIRSGRRFLILVHTNLDGDAIGAELAFARLLRKLGKTAVCVNDDKIPYGYGFLPGVGSIRRYRQGMKTAPFDRVVVLDCSDLKRAGQSATLALPGVLVVNIDHHISNAGFGAANLVDPNASCSCEMIYRLFKRMRIAVDRQTAMLLYVGILTDTGSFKYSNTRPSTHAIAAELLATGVDASFVYKKIYSSVPYEDMKLLSRILPTMRAEAGGAVVWFELSKELMRGTGACSFDLSESILNFGRSINGVEVVILFKENLDGTGGVRVNFRSQGQVDVNRLAGAFGGGGHKTAAGTTIHGKSLAQVVKMVLAKVKTMVR